MSPGPLCACGVCECEQAQEDKKREGRNKEGVGVVNVPCESACEYTHTKKQRLRPRLSNCYNSNIVYLHVCLRWF